VAVPTFVFLFTRIHAYYKRAGIELGVGTVPEKPVGKRTLVIVPVTNVSRLTCHAVSEALSLGQEVIAVSVVIDQGDEGRNSEQSLEQEWSQWDTGVPLRILHTEYSSVVAPIVAFIDEQRGRSDQQIVVLIPVVIPDRFRYRILHNQIDRVLSAALRARTDLVVARVSMPLQDPQDSVEPPLTAGERVATVERPGARQKPPE
jgi:ABC-type dipeptide/oligopeptide/nickel transport system ATPase component